MVDPNIDISQQNPINEKDDVSNNASSPSRLKMVIILCVVILVLICGYFVWNNLWHKSVLYTDMVRGFSIKYPAEWSFDTKKIYGGNVGFVSPDKRSFVIITSEPIGMMSLSEYVSAFKNAFPTISIYYENAVTLGGVPGVLVKYKDTTTKGIQFSTLAQIVVYGGNGYVIEGGSSPQDFNYNEQTLLRAASSFRVFNALPLK